MKKVIKIILIIIMLLGIVFSISNFIIPGKIKAASEKGVWVYVNGDWECTGDGESCDIGELELD
jgi:hypothetical protein